ncbi:MAG: hypothetical protein AAFR26_01545 [Cyanobacteria bacterium J06626_4]
MTLPEFVSRVVAFAYVVANLLVFVLATTAYQDTRKRCFLMLAISSGTGAILAILPWIPVLWSSWTFWGLWNLMSLSDLILWVIGLRLLVNEYVKMAARIAQQRAVLNANFEAPVDNPNTFN